jgi:hypothetical protein
MQYVVKYTDEDGTRWRTSRPLDQDEADIMYDILQGLDDTSEIGIEEVTDE